MRPLTPSFTRSFTVQYQEHAGHRLSEQNPTEDADEHGLYDTPTAVTLVGQRGLRRGSPLPYHPVFLVPLALS